MGIKRYLLKLLGKYNEKEEYIKLMVSRGLKLGREVDIFSEYPFDANYPWLISVGNYVTIAANVRILAHDASMGYETRMAKIGRVEIGDYVFIGNGSVILCNCKIGNHVIIGAGSVVTTDIPDGCVYAGNPAKFICTTEEFKNKHMAKAGNALVVETPWQELANATEDVQKDIKACLSDTYGYVKLEPLEEHAKES